MECRENAWDIQGCAITAFNRLVKEVVPFNSFHSENGKLSSENLFEKLSGAFTFSVLSAAILQVWMNSGEILI